MTRKGTAVAGAVALAAAALLALPGPAGGKTEVTAVDLGDAGLVIHVRGTDGDDNLTVEVSGDGFDVVFTDPDGVQAPVPPCVRENEIRMRCPLAGVEEIEVELGAGNDVLDVIEVEAEIEAEGGEGEDRIDGGSGPDRLRGGADRDFLDGNLGPDIRSGGPGDDLLRASAGNDVQLGGPGDDRIAGGTGNDVQLGGPGGDRLRGGPGKDEQDGGGGMDSCDRGAGRRGPAERCERIS